MAEETASAFAPCSSASRAPTASSTHTMMAIPSPSEMWWLRRRVPGTAWLKRNWLEASRLAWRQALVAGPVRAGWREELDQRRPAGPGAHRMRRVRGDDPSGAGAQILLLVADPERQRATREDADLLVHVGVLGHVGVRLELDRGQRRLGTVQRAADHAVPDHVRRNLVKVIERAHTPIGCQTVFSSRNAEIS